MTLSSISRSLTVLVEWYPGTTALSTTCRCPFVSFIDWGSIGLSLSSWRKSPEFRATVGGSVYITQGLPLQQSTGLVDRGMFVWVVPEADAEQSGKAKAKTFILKNAWRTCGRLAESTIYKDVVQYNEGIDLVSDRFGRHRTVRRWQ